MFIEDLIHTITDVLNVNCTTRKIRRFYEHFSENVRPIGEFTVVVKPTEPLTNDYRKRKFKKQAQEFITAHCDRLSFDRIICINGIQFAADEFHLQVKVDRTVLQGLKDERAALVELREFLEDSMHSTQIGYASLKIEPEIY